MNGMTKLTIMMMSAAVLSAGCAGHGFSIRITDAGAVQDTCTDNASIINSAIDRCSRNGGGTVIIPEGRFMSSTIYMRPDVTLMLDEGAELVASSRLASYGHLTADADLSRYDTGKGSANSNCASDTTWTKALILAEKADRASITGTGRIDGRHIVNPAGEEGMRGPHAILIAESTGVTISGITIDKASNYAILCYDIEGCRFSGITVTQGWDGIHIRGGKDIAIDSCSFSTGDDCIAGGWWKDMSINGCRFNSSCNGIRMIMPSENVDIENCSFTGPGIYPHRTDSYEGGRMMHGIIMEPGAWGGDASGELSGIRLRNIRAENLLAPFCMTLLDGQHCSDITVENFDASGTYGMALSVKSWKSATIDSVRISNSSFSFIGNPEPGLEKKILSMPEDRWPFFPSYGAYFRNVGKVTLDNVVFSTKGTDSRQAVMTKNVGRIDER